MRFAEQRLRTIEMISKYREDKIKREFLKLEEELRSEEEKVRMESQKERKRRLVMENIKKEIAEFKQQKDEGKMEEKAREDFLRKSIKAKELQNRRHNEQLVSTLYRSFSERTFRRRRSVSIERSNWWFSSKRVVSTQRFPATRETSSE